MGDIEKGVWPRRPSVTPPPTIGFPPENDVVGHPDVWFAPNVASADLRGLAERPGEWLRARSGITTLQLYAQQLAADRPGQHGVGPNDYASLIDGGVLDMLDRWEMKLAIECSAVKEWSKDGREAFFNMRDVVIPRAQSRTEQLSAILLDEPLVAGQALGQSIEETARHTAWFIRSVRDLGFNLEVGLVEAYPYLRMADIMRFIELLQENGGGPASLHFDPDRFGFRDQGISEQRARDALNEAQRRCREWQIPMGVIVFGQRARNEAEYRNGRPEHGSVRSGAVPWAQQLHGWLPTLDRVIPQSWEDRGDGGVKDLPRNLTDSDAVSHTGIVRTVRSLWA